MKKIIVYILVIGCSVKLNAQNNNSPYSILGIGDVEKSSFDRTSGMGHAGVALSSSRFMYNVNPASYISLGDPYNQYFHVETAARFKAVTYSGSPISNSLQTSSTDAQFKKFALAFKIKPKWWAMSVGILPFSTANYSFNNKKTVTGSNQVISAYIDGSGNTSQLYLANSFKITKNLSVGIQSAYLFGQLDENEALATTYFTDSILITDRNISLANLYFKFGFQYKAKLSKNLTFAFGGTVSPQTKLRANTTLKVTNGTNVIINNESYKSNYLTLPIMATGGIAAIIKDKFTIAADYNYQDWAKLNYKGIGYSLVNSNRLSLGGEYIKRSEDFSEKFFLQAGFFYSNSYVKINGQQLDDIGGTFGGGFTFFRSSRNPTAGNMSLAGALEVGTRGTTANGLVKENYTQFSITLSYRDFWYTRPRKYD
jgi:hypothetical protein